MLPRMVESAFQQTRLPWDEGMQSAMTDSPDWIYIDKYARQLIIIGIIYAINGVTVFNDNLILLAFKVIPLDRLQRIICSVIQES